jgi:serine/threonine-protein kinase
MPRPEVPLARFFAAHPDRQRVRDVVEAAGFSILAVVPQYPWRSDRYWGLVLRMSPTLAELFGRRADVLLYGSDSTQFERPMINEIMGVLDAYSPRLSNDFVIVVSGDRDAADLVAAATDRLDTVYVGIPMHRIGTLAPHGEDTLTRLLQSRVYARDLYQLTGAITDSQRFFGRQTLINELEAALRLKGHVGLFGLRKMGKTSLLYRILEKLRAHPTILAAHVDTQRIDVIGRSSAYFLWSLGEALFDTNRSVQTTENLRLFGRHRMFADVPPSMRADMSEYFWHDVRRVLAGQDRRRIVFLVDEIERMWPGKKPRDGGWGRAFVDVWRLLRGIEQENPGRISYFVTGTSPECLEATEAAGEENPLHRYIERRFLPNLDDMSRRELLTRIGDRIGVKWTDTAIRFVVQQVSGHPSLLRTVGSFVHRTLASRTGPVTVDENMVRDLFRGALPELNASFRQITEALHESYPDDFMLLDLLANGRVAEYKDLASIAPDALVHLEGYELVDTRKNLIELEALQTFLQRQHREARASSGEARHSLHPDSTFEGYTVLQIVSSGGFGDVYKVRRTGGDDGEVLALKVFHKGSFEQLLREVEALEEIRHPNVLRIVAYDKAADGSVYLVSEYLEGDTLERHCTRTFRLTDDEATSTFRALLGALAAFHPNLRRLGELRAQEELSAEEADELTRVRAGFIHRDIKPANVIAVPARGPVLIDFGIASRIATPVKTMSATPGYLPPDFDMSGWSPDVDLYQLGLTMLQARLGVPYGGSAGGVEALRELLRHERHVEPRLRATLLALTEPERARRPESASAVLEALA